MKARHHKYHIKPKRKPFPEVVKRFNRVALIPDTVSSTNGIRRNLEKSETI